MKEEEKKKIECESDEESARKLTASLKCKRSKKQMMISSNQYIDIQKIRIQVS